MPNKSLKTDVANRHRFCKKKQNRRRFATPLSESLERMAEKLWLHAYSGKEHGLMVVGTQEALRELGEKLVACSSQHEGSQTAWPPEVAAPEVVGPYKDIPDFTLSFHLQGSAPLQSVLPLGRRTLPTALFLGIAACAITGAVVIFRWALAYAL